MAGDIYTSIGSIINLIITIGVTLGLLYILYEVGCWALEQTLEIVNRSLKLIGIVLEGTLIVGTAFIIVIGALFVVFPSSFYLDIHTNNQNFDIGVPLVEFTGTYENTNAGYIIKPNIYQIPVSSTLTVKQKDKTHLNLFTDFVKAKDQPIKGVIRYVPDR